MGRQLVAVNEGEITYTYNEDGIRTSKTFDGVTTNYYLDGTNIIYQSDGTNELYFYYDKNDELIGFKYQNNNYFYIKNALGVITDIVDENGNIVVSYEYNPWGETIALSGNSIIADINPFRYKSYYYDCETDIYYLQSRYYYAYICRFLNCDDVNYIGATESELSYNPFAYCENEPVKNSDPSGMVLSNVIGLVIGAVIGAIGGYFIAKWLSGKINFKYDWQRKAFIGGLTALATASAAAIGYFLGPYVAKAWYYLRARISGLVRQLFKGINTKSLNMSHLNSPKHLWNQVLGNQASNVNVKNLVFRAIRNGEWRILNNGTVGIHWYYNGKLIEITGKVVNGIFHIGNAWVWNGVSNKLW